MIFAATPAKVAAAPAAGEIAAANALHAEGRALAARERLVRLLESPAIKTPAERALALEALLEICLGSLADACLARFGPQYASAAEHLPAANDVQRAELARKAAYWFDRGRLAQGDPDVTAQILEWAPWRNENAYNGELYLRRQLLAAEVLLAQGRAEAVDERLGRILSLVASAENPQAARLTLARTLARAILLLQQIGQTERAFGLYHAAGPFVREALPALSADAVLWRVTEGQLLQETGDLKGAAVALDAAVATLDRIELDEEPKAWLAGSALTLKAAVCAAAGDAACARAAIGRHPAAGGYAEPGRVPESYDEVAYLAARALAASLSGETDPAAVGALKRAELETADARLAAEVQTYRAAGAALGSPAGPERSAALAELARRLKARAELDAGAGRRPGAIDQLLIALALSEAERIKDMETVFALAQLSARAGPAFETDALAALASAKDDLQRRTVHQALRLRARRDRMERTGIQGALARTAGAGEAVLRHDHDARRQLRDFNLRIAEAERVLGQAGLSFNGRPVTLARFQAALASNEAALAVAPAARGLTYLCVRRGSATAVVRPADTAQMRLDARVVQAALTAGHAPSERLDAQFPAAQAVRLYEATIRPFEACLKPQDRIVWLSSVATAQVPLAILLPAAPPKAPNGYDLAAADWLVRRHAIAYAGSAAVVVAARTGGRRDGDFDFLGVGDPVLGEAGKARDLLRGVRAGARFEGLAPLPETRAELEASARGFAAARVLLAEEATERRFRSELAGAYRFLSFATHGLIRDDLQGLAEPALVLTPVSDADAADDGLLTATEIADLTLEAAFVALSACNTANFDLEQMAEGLPALASAFAVAGTPATLGTLWPVETETGKRVVTNVFERLKAGLAPSDALAEAQRAFLAAPPSRAFLHPRFWAPFVLLGDGGLAPSGAAGGPRLEAVEVLTKTGGEVLALARAGERVAQRYIGDREAGRHAAGVRLAETGGREAWRREIRGPGASAFVAELDGRLVASGYALSDDGRYAPVLEALDPVSGAVSATWRGDGVSPVDAVPLAAAQLSRSSAVVAIGALNLRDPGVEGGGRLHVFRFGADLAPRLLFSAEAAGKSRLEGATLTPLGEDLLVTYTEIVATGAAPDGWDGYDEPACPAEPVTWVELRDGVTGALKARHELRGFSIAAAAPGPDGRVRLGGARGPACSDRKRAAILAVTPALRVEELYLDATLGGSEVRSLSAMPDGRTFVAASKESAVDIPSGPATAAEPYGGDARFNAFNGLVFTLDRQGRATSPKLLAAPAGMFVAAAEASRPGEVLLGGSLAGQAAVFRLSAPAGGLPQRGR